MPAVAVSSSIPGRSRAREPKIAHEYRKTRFLDIALGSCWRVDHLRGWGGALAAESYRSSNRVAVRML